MRTSIITLALSLASVTTANAAPPWDSLPPKERDAWQRLIGLEAGIALMHCVQPLSAAAGEIEWRPKHWVAIGGCALYGANTVGLWQRQNWALWVNVVGPIVGITMVSTGWALNAAGVIEAEIRPDVPQLVGGVLQAWAWIESYRLLRLQRARKNLTITAFPGGVQVRWLFD